MNSLHPAILPVKFQSAAERSRYDEGYDAGWSGKRSSANPHFREDDAVTPAADEWERGRFDGRRDKRD